MGKYLAIASKFQFDIAVFALRLMRRTLRQERKFASLLNQMSPELRGEVTVQTYYKWLSAAPYLCGRTMCQELPVDVHEEAMDEYNAFAMALSVKITQEAFPPLEPIVLANTLCDTLCVPVHCYF